jgi:hypothetical protein
MSDLLKELTLHGESRDRNALFMTADVGMVFSGEEIAASSLEYLKNNSAKLTNPVFFDLAAFVLCESGVNEVVLAEDMMIVISDIDTSQEIQFSTWQALARHFDSVTDNCQRNESLFDKIRKRPQLEIDFTAHGQLKTAF